MPARSSRLRRRATVIVDILTPTPTPAALLTLCIGFGAFWLVDVVAESPDTPFPSEVEQESAMYFGGALGSPADETPSTRIDEPRSFVRPATTAVGRLTSAHRPDERRDDGRAREGR
jgi:hypothetical protein